MAADWTLERAQNEYRKLAFRVRELEQDRIRLTADLQRQQDVLAESLSEKRTLFDSHSALQSQLAGKVTEHHKLWRRSKKLQQAHLDSGTDAQKLRTELHHAKSRVPGLTWAPVTPRRMLFPSSGTHKERLESNISSGSVLPEIWPELYVILAEGLETTLKEGRCDFCSFPASMALLIGFVWSACACALLDILQDPAPHWLICWVALALVLVFIILLMRQLQLCMKQVFPDREASESSAEDSASDHELLRSHRKQGMAISENCDSNERAQALAHQVLSPLNRYFMLQQSSLTFGAVLATQQVILLLLIALCYPKKCSSVVFHAQAQANISHSTGMADMDAGEVWLQCSRLHEISAAFSSAAVWLARSLPVAWGLVWHTRTRSLNMQCAVVIAKFAEWYDSVALPKPAVRVGLSLHNQIRQQLRALVCDLGLQRQWQFRMLCLLVLDVWDCMDLWLVATMAPQLVIAEVSVGASAGAPVQDQRGDPVAPGTVKLVRATMLGTVLFALAALAWSGILCSSCQQLRPIQVTMENNHDSMIQFVTGHITVLGHNRELAKRAVLSTCIIDTPFLIVRLLLGTILHIWPSILVVKNLACWVCSAAIVCKYWGWSREVHLKRTIHVKPVLELHRHMQDVAAAKRDPPAHEIQQPEKFADLYDTLEELEADLFGLSRVDIYSLLDAPQFPLPSLKLEPGGGSDQPDSVDSSSLGQMTLSDQAVSDSDVDDGQGTNLETF